jgi:hypothetical protein
MSGHLACVCMLPVYRHNFIEAKETSSVDRSPPYLHRAVKFLLQDSSPCSPPLTSSSIQRSVSSNYVITVVRNTLFGLVDLGCTGD